MRKLILGLLFGMCFIPSPLIFAQIADQSSDGVLVSPPNHNANQGQGRSDGTVNSENNASIQPDQGNHDNSWRKGRHRHSKHDSNDLPNNGGQ